jgi:hypothetical protein
MTDDNEDDIIIPLKNSYLTNYGQNVQLWTFGVTMVTFMCVIL